MGVLVPMDGPVLTSHDRTAPVLPQHVLLARVLIHCNRMARDERLARERARDEQKDSLRSSVEARNPLDCSPPSLRFARDEPRLTSFTRTPRQRVPATNSQHCVAGANPVSNDCFYRRAVWHVKPVLPASEGRRRAVDASRQQYQQPTVPSSQTTVHEIRERPTVTPPASATPRTTPRPD
jgi:hypothetical protein